jgi:hypothetical protein
VILSNNEDTLLRAIHEVNKRKMDYNFEISIQKTKKMTFCGKWTVRCKLILYIEAIEVSKSNCLSCQLLYQGEVDVSHTEIQ